MPYLIWKNVRHAKGEEVLKSVGVIAGRLALFLLLWWLFGVSVEAFRGIPFVMPHDVLMRLYHLMQGDVAYETSLGWHVFMSLKRWFLAYTIAVVLGIVLGMVFGFSKKAYPFGHQVSTVLQVMPGLAWIPFAMLLFGIGERATLFMIVMSAFPPIFLHVSTGCHTLPEERFLLARMMNLSTVRTFFMVVLPSIALPLLTGLRLGLAIGWRVLIAAEMVVGSSVGLGYTIIQSRWSLDFEMAFIAIGAIMAVGLFFEKWVFARLESVLKKRLGYG